MQKPSIPRGTRDFGPDQMAKRNFILNIIKAVYQKFGFSQLETPTLENLSVLTGKYGDEGDQLLFKVLNSGDFLNKTSVSDYENGSKALLPKIAEKGLRYDLTVPFARYVVMNQNEISFPFKRYQIQPVWRADRPQKGRYREFYQCDADVVGTNSLLCEAEIIVMINEAFANMGLKDFTIKINNRKILEGFTEAINAPGKESDFCVAIDKLDKIGKEKVFEELTSKGFEKAGLDKLTPIFETGKSLAETLAFLENFFTEGSSGAQGLMEVKEILSLLEQYGDEDYHVQLDLTLARGLSYYTGAIFEVKANNVQIGSICGGGRYDNLTGVFGLKDVSGVGISFGVDRIYDVLEELGLFPESNEADLQVLITNFGNEYNAMNIKALNALRKAGLNSELYPDSSKLKKQFNYANKRGVPYVVVVGEDEMKSGEYMLKDMRSGEQTSYNLEDLISKILNSQ